ncbi:MAG: AMP-binding protein [Bacteroidia bacterium]
MFFDLATKTFREENVDADKIAFVAVDKPLTWIELKSLSDELCKILAKTSISKGHPVLVYGDKEAFFLVSLLSCLRMGFPFIPINNQLPEKRVEKIIAQTQSQLLIVTGNYTAIPKMPIIIKDDFSISRNASSPLSGENLRGGCAYILFTSGSSGEPKGVIITDENVISFTQWFVKNFHIKKETVFINQASFLFDIALADFFGSLQTGATSIFNTSEITSSPDLFFSNINTYKGTYWNSTPSFISVYLAHKNFNETTLPSIKQFVLSGEDLSVTLTKQLKRCFPNARIINAYGPTETTIYASFVEISDAMLHEKSLPISKVDNETIYLDEDEIIISGKQVGTGYLNNGSLMQQKFFSTGNKKEFRSGDLAYVKNDYIYYAGRKDEQLKLNGHRIELKEVQYALERIEFVKQSACIPIVIDGKVKRLIAFVTMIISNPSLKYGDGIKELLKKELPAYMIPSEIIVLDAFPYTASFKVDKQKLLSDYLNPTL